MNILLLCDRTRASELRRLIGSSAAVSETSDRVDRSDIGGYDLAVSYGYRHILRADALEACRCINLHISLLPFNRGADPNVWSILENSPKGVSIHVIDPGIDTGPILLQEEVHFEEGRHSLRSSYELLHSRIQALFHRNLLQLMQDRIPATPQVGKGSFHSTADFSRIRERLLGSEGWDLQIPELKERFARIRSELL